MIDSDSFFNCRLLKSSIKLQLKMDEYYSGVFHHQVFFNTTAGKQSLLLKTFH
jgi:hypothetical protein